MTVKRDLPTIINSSKERADDIWKELVGAEMIEVHDDCRKLYTCKTSIKADRKASSPTQSDLCSPVKKKLLSKNEFDYKHHCLICGEICDRPN